MTTPKRLKLKHQIKEEMNPDVDTNTTEIRRKRPSAVKPDRSSPAIKNDPIMALAENDEDGYVTKGTCDELIYPDATYQSYEEFEEKFNQWKAKYLHPFRVASSEALRTQEGTISEKFRYRYVVFHCARYGNPRMRGEGKRPNQNYLPCSCNAMLRLNFQYNEQCLKLTSLETRHSNHNVCQELYDKMVHKEQHRKGGSGVRVRKQDTGEKKKKSGTQSVKKSPNRTEDESFDENYSFNDTGRFEMIERKVFGKIEEVSDQTEVKPAESAVLQLADTNVQNPMFLNPMNLPQATLTNAYIPFATADWRVAPSIPPMFPTLGSTGSPSQTSPSSSSSTTDENEAPVFTILDAIRPIPLRPAENTDFVTNVLTPALLQQNTQITNVLSRVHKMLTVGMNQEVLQLRMHQLDVMLANWEHFANMAQNKL
uniref:ZSWIM3 N-terminal domain-containing protein n=1 Tax=Caenorhabditis japonica TaxID=281687 RepID=A0A8R1HUQ6_CAEJA